MDAFQTYLARTKPGDVIRHRETGARFVRINPGGYRDLDELSVCNLRDGGVIHMCELILWAEDFDKVFEIL